MQAGQGQRARADPHRRNWIAISGGRTVTAGLRSSQQWMASHVANELERADAAGPYADTIPVAFEARHIVGQVARPGFPLHPSAAGRSWLGDGPNRPRRPRRSRPGEPGPRMCCLQPRRRSSSPPSARFGTASTRPLWAATARFLRVRAKGCLCVDARNSVSPCPQCSRPRRPWGCLPLCERWLSVRTEASVRGGSTAPARGHPAVLPTVDGGFCTRPPWTTGMETFGSGARGRLGPMPACSRWCPR
jgi:hypothetical protein